MTTLTAVQPPGRFGSIHLMPGTHQITQFMEKPLGDGGWVNGGFFVVDNEVLERIEGDSTVWEQEPLGGMAEEGKLFAYKHAGFWHPMDTLRDRVVLEELWASGNPPWRTWA
jgi:glucose-1-phosphate cytidylyltransferase